MNELQKYYDSIPFEKRKNDLIRLVQLINDNVPDSPRVWDGKSIGFGDYHYVNKTNEGDMSILGLVAAKAHVTLYFTVGGLDPYKDYLERIGKYKRGKICLYISNINNIDTDVFEELVKKYYQDVLDGTAIYT